MISSSNLFWVSLCLRISRCLIILGYCLICCLHHDHHLSGATLIIVRWVASAASTAVVGRSWTILALPLALFRRGLVGGGVTVAVRVGRRGGGRATATWAALRLTVTRSSLTFLVIFHLFVVGCRSSLLLLWLFLWFFSEFMFVLWSLVPHDKIVSLIQFDGLRVEVRVVLAQLLEELYRELLTPAASSQPHFFKVAFVAEVLSDCDCEVEILHSVPPITRYEYRLAGVLDSFNDLW